MRFRFFVSAGMLALMFASGAVRAQDVLALDGTWRFQLDPKGVGEQERWFDRELDEVIRLPGTTDLAGKGYALDRATMSYPVAHLRSGFVYSRGAKRMDEVGYLVRDHLFIGKAWYQRTIEIPTTWADRRVELRLERVQWQSTVWLDGKRIGSCDSLVAEHRFDLGRARPGEHVVSIRVDNDLVHPIGIIAHAYGPETQSRWNGIVGKITLTARAPVRVARVLAFPAADRRSVRVRLETRNETGAAARCKLRWTLEPERGGAPLCVVENEQQAPVGSGSCEQVLQATEPCRPWDEFHPTRYRLRVELVSDAGRDVHRTLFGFRHIARVGRRIEVNGRRIFLRGTLDCCVYPRTGHPPMSVDAWLGVLGTVRQYGFNHVRFHTWCPPDAAFEAADRLGLYLAPEAPFWVDDWVAATKPRPKPLGGDPRVTDFIRNEVRRISEAYGNHPSFAFFCLGNEFGNHGTDWKLANQLIEEAKRSDPRRLYNASTARKRLPADDYWVTHAAGAATRGVGPAHTDWDFSRATSRNDLPLIAHETGQRPVFPDYDELLPKFTGPLKPYNLERLRRMAVATGVVAQIGEFERASARFQLVQYKAEHEGMLRTPEFGGYQLLMLNDFTGQSEAYVGVLDPFWESKGVVRVADVREWNAPTVILARFARYVWSREQTFRARLEVAHYGRGALTDASASWSLTTRAGQVVAAGETTPKGVPSGGVTELGKVVASFAPLQRATALVFRVELGGVSNHWPIWVEPAAEPQGDRTPDGILVTHAFDPRTKLRLEHGGRVLLLSHGMKHARADRARNGFESVYWSGGWWGNRFSQLGILCRPEHAALAGFPTEGHSDWQWHGLTATATTFDLTGLVPKGYRPIVQAVPDFHHNRLLGQVFELRFGPGRLLVCGYDLTQRLASRPAARAMRRSLLRYMQSDAFDPRTSISEQQAATLFPPRMSWGATRNRLGATVRASSQAEGYGAELAIDGDPNTIWHTPWTGAAPAHPHTLILDLKKPRRIAGLRYLPRQDQANGRVRSWALHVSANGVDWGEPIARGTWPDATEAQVVQLPKVHTARYLELIANSEVNGHVFAAVAELEVLLAQD